MGSGMNWGGYMNNLLLAVSDVAIIHQKGTSTIAAPSASNK